MVELIPDHLDMEAKFDLILKELHDLKLRVYGLESKSNEGTLENCNNRRRMRALANLELMKMT